MTCHACRAELQFKERISRTDDCPSCGADVHCCLNCVNYDTAAHNRCREPQAEWVSDRERANFCDFFSPNTKNASANKQPPNTTQPGNPRSAFENLFKK